MAGVSFQDWLDSNLCCPHWLLHFWNLSTQIILRHQGGVSHSVQWLWSSLFYTPKTSFCGQCLKTKMTQKRHKNVSSDSVLHLSTLVTLQTSFWFVPNLIGWLDQTFYRCQRRSTWWGEKKGSQRGWLWGVTAATHCFMTQMPGSVVLQLVSITVGVLVLDIGCNRQRRS